MNYRNKIILCFLLALTACLEEVPLITQDANFDDLVVIEGIITSDFKNQKIKLSFSKKFEDELFLPVENAVVRVETDNGDVFSFQEQSNGEYFSTQPFAAQIGVKYKLFVEMSGGNTITSDQENIAETSNIDRFFAEKAINDKGISGVAIKVSPVSNFSEGGYFRYEWEETYKIVAPNWNPFEFIVINDQFPEFEVDIQLRTEEQKTCFSTNTSQDIILNKTITNSENNEFEFRFISEENPVLAHRYSIKLIQYTQTQQAASYWKTLQDFSSRDNVFSQIQPGFINGNLTTDVDDQVVIGYFEVASVSEKRIFLNRSDFYADEESLPYFVDCTAIGSPPLFTSGSHPMGVTTSPLIDAIRSKLITYYGVNENPLPEEGPYFTTKRECGDCTALGTNEKPEFWID